MAVEVSIACILVLTSAGVGAIPSALGQGRARAGFVTMIDPAMQGVSLLDPAGIAYDARLDHLLVANTGGNRIEILTSQGILRKRLGEKGGVDGPVDLAVDRRGTLYFSEIVSGLVRWKENYQDAGDGNFTLLDLGKANTSKSPVISRLFLDHKGTLFLLDRANQSVHCFDENRRWERSFPLKAGRNGALPGEGHLAVDPKGMVYVSEPGAHRVAAFSPSGKYLYDLGRFPEVRVSEWSPEALSVDRRGRIWVADPVHQRLWAFSSSGQLLVQVSNEQFSEDVLSLVFDMAVDSFQHLFCLRKGTATIAIMRVEE